MMGLKEGDFKRMQKGIDNFIHKKRIYRGRGKYCSRKIGGISSPKMFERYITSQLTWLKRGVYWSKEGGYKAPLWFLPMVALLEKYYMPDFHIIMQMGNEVVDSLCKLCEFEGLGMMSELLSTLLETRRRSERKMTYFVKHDGGIPEEHPCRKMCGAIPWIGSIGISFKKAKLRSSLKEKPPDLLASSFLTNIIRGRIHLLWANTDIDGNYVENPGFELLGGYNEQLMNECIKGIKGTIRSYKVRGLTSKGGIKPTLSPITEFIVYGGCKTNKSFN